MRGRWTLWLLALAVGARVVAALTLGGSFHFVDEATYVDASRHLLAGEGFGTGYRNVPAYPVLLAILGAPWPRDLLVLRCTQALVAGVGVLALLAFGRRAFGPGPALIGGLLYALDPLLVITAGLFYPEASAALALLAVLAAVWTARRHDRLAAAAAAGVLLALLVQLRPVAFVLLPVLGFWLAATLDAPVARRALHALALAAACVVALAPWGVRNYRVHGYLVPAGMAGVKGGPVAGEEIVEHGLAASLARRLWLDPLGIARHVASEIGHFWELYPTRLQTDNPQRREALHERDPRLPTEAAFPSGPRDVASALSFGTELALALVGVLAGWRGRRAETVLLVAVSVVYGLGYALFFAKLRYRITVLPCVLLLAGVGATALLDLVARDAPRRRARA